MHFGKNLLPNSDHRLVRPAVFLSKNTRFLKIPPYTHPIQGSEVVTKALLFVYQSFLLDKQGACRGSYVLTI